MDNSQVTEIFKNNLTHVKYTDALVIIVYYFILKIKVICMSYVKYTSRRGGGFF